MPDLLSQLQEAHLLRASTSSEEFKWRPTRDHDEEAWEAALERVEAGEEDSGEDLRDLPSLSYALRLDDDIWLRVDYDAPGRNAPQFDLHAPLASPSIKTMLQRRLDETVASSIKNEEDNLIFAAYTELQALVAEQQVGHDSTNIEGQTGEGRKEESQPATADIPTSSTVDMLRVIFWTHHLKAPSKKRDMTRWCAELSVFGLVKSGYPGFLCFEGPRDGVTEIVRRIKSLQWHAITVKTEEPYTCTLAKAMPVAAAEEAALARCLLGIGHSSMKAWHAAGGPDKGVKLRTSMDEIEAAKELVERLRAAEIPEDELKFALNLRS